MRALSPQVQSDVVLLAGVAVVFDRIVLNDGGRLIQVKLLTQFGSVGFSQTRFGIIQFLQLSLVKLSGDFLYINMLLNE